MSRRHRDKYLYSQYIVSPMRSYIFNAIVPLWSVIDEKFKWLGRAS